MNKSFFLQCLIATLITGFVGLAVFLSIGFVQSGAIHFNEVLLLYGIALCISLPIVATSIGLISVAKRIAPAQFYKVIYFTLPPIVACGFLMAILFWFKKYQFSIELFPRDWPILLIAIGMGLAFSLYWSFDHK